jgi:hypothetical protein
MMRRRKRRRITSDEEMKYEGLAIDWPGNHQGCSVTHIGNFPLQRATEPAPRIA